MEKQKGASLALMVTVRTVDRLIKKRLIPEMRLASIKTLEETNKFVIEYLRSYNKQFSLQHNYTTSAFEKIDKKIN